MNKLPKYIITIFTLLPLLGCQKTQVKSNDLDNKSYINDFELIQENTTNNTRIKITSPQAIIDPTNNDIEITESSIQILNAKGKDIKITSGKSSLDNFKNLIRVYKNVNIALINNKDSYIKTESFYWNLRKATIDLNNPLKVNFPNTTIISSNGIYNIDSDQLTINNNIFNRKVFNKEGEQIYQIKIMADIAKWIKDKNQLEFTSSDKQVETTINFLSLK